MNKKIPEYFNENQTCFQVEKKTVFEYARSHTHAYLEITFYKKANGIDRSNNTEHIVCDGALTIALPYQVHQLRLENPREVEYYTLCLSKVALQYLDYPNSTLATLIYNEITHKNNFLLFEDKAYVHLVDLFEAAVKLYQSDDSFNKLELKAKLIEIMTIIARHWREENGQNAANDELPRDISLQKNYIFWNIVEHVNLNINQVLSTQLLAERYNVSKSYISINFKKYFGLTFHEYINEMRLRNAEALLLSTDLPITDIAYEAGFESFSTFSRLFKAYKGETASSFRKHQHMQ